MTGIELIRLHELHPVMRRPLQLVLVQGNAALASDGLEFYLIECARSPEEAAANWAKGRRQLPDGSWEITDPDAIVTKTQHGSKHVPRPPKQPWAEAGDVGVRETASKKFHDFDHKHPERSEPRVIAAYDLLRNLCDTYELAVPFDWDRYHVQMGPELEARAREMDRLTNAAGGHPLGSQGPPR